MRLPAGYPGEIRARLEAAMPGPWEPFIEGRDPPGPGYDSFIRTGGEDIYLTGATGANQDVIAHARPDVGVLLDEIERLTVLSHP